MLQEKNRDQTILVLVGDRTGENIYKIHTLNAHNTNGRILRPFHLTHLNVCMRVVVIQSREYREKLEGPKFL
jgi:hypothetical protein